MCTYSLGTIQVKDGIINDEKYKFIFSVEEVNKLVQEGISFRDAYKIVGKSIQEGSFNPDKVLQHSHIGSVGNLSLDKIIEKRQRV